MPTTAVDRSVEDAQGARLADLRKRRNASAVASTLDDLKSAAGGAAKVLRPMKSALAAGATVGEVSETLADVFGRYHPSR